MSDDNIFNCGLITGIIIGCLFMYFMTHPERRDKTEMKAEIKPCACVTAKEVILYYERYEMFLNQGKKDSVAKYASLLKF